MPIIAWVIFLAAALLEVGGDAITRSGLRGHGRVYVLCGMAMLALYGLVINTLRWDFSRLIGVYVGVFALVSVLTGRYLLRESIPSSTWLGLGIIIAGGLVIQFGSK